MSRIAIVEDNDTTAEKLHGPLTRYAAEDNETFDIAMFGGTVSLLDNYKNIYDTVFTDVELPYIDGAEAAKRLRALDKQMMLIFITNVTRYAVKSYEMDTPDYLVRPIHYGDFELKLHRAVLRRGGDQEAILVVRQDGFLRLRLQGIRYAEVRGHTLISRTGTDSIRGSRTLLGTEGKLKGKEPLRYNKCHLVNQKHIAAVQGYTLVVTGGEELQISRPRKKALIGELAGILGNEYVL